MTQPRPPRPRFTHDHEHPCIFLGPAVVNGQLADVYLCPQAGMPTAIMRFSDSGPDYSTRTLMLWSPADRAEVAELVARKVLSA